MSQTPKKPHDEAPQPVFGLEELKALITLVARERVQAFEFESGDLKFRILKDAAAPASAAPHAAVAGPTQTVAATTQPAPDEPAEDPSIHYITSPIVGTFYRAPNPTASPYVQVGDFVKPGQILCIVEAMKLMNEIECDVAGELVKVLVESGQPVEYGERLYAVRVG